MTSEWISEEELARIRDRHSDTEQDSLLDDEEES